MSIIKKIYSEDHLVIEEEFPNINFRHIIYFYKYLWKYIDPHYSEKEESDLKLLSKINMYKENFEEEITNNYLELMHLSDFMDDITFTNTKNVKNIKLQIQILFTLKTLEYNFPNSEMNETIKIDFPLILRSATGFYHHIFMFETIDNCRPIIKCTAKKIFLPQKLRIYLFLNINYKNFPIVKKEYKHKIQIENEKIIDLDLINQKLKKEIKEDVFYTTMLRKEQLLKELIWHPKTTFQKEESMKYYEEYNQLL